MGILEVTVLALALALAQLAPFLLAGDFHMFAFSWAVAGGPIHLLVDGSDPEPCPSRPATMRR